MKMRAAKHRHLHWISIGPNIAGTSLLACWLDRHGRFRRTFSYPRFRWTAEQVAAIKADAARLKAKMKQAPIAPD